MVVVGPINEDEPVTPTRPSRSATCRPTTLPASARMGTSTGSLSYVETAYRAPGPRGPGAVFSRISRECSATPPPSPNHSRSPSPEPVTEYSNRRARVESVADEDDPFVCPSPSTFGVSPRAPRVETRNTTTLRTNQQPVRPLRYRSTGDSLYPALPSLPPNLVPLPPTMPPTPITPTSPTLDSSATWRADDPTWREGKHSHLPLGFILT